MCMQPRGNRAYSPQKPQSNLKLTSTGKCSQLSGWKTKRHIKVLNSFSTLDSSIAISADTTLHTPYLALTVITSISPPSSAPSRSPTSLPDDLASIPPGPAPSYLTSGPAPSAPTQPCLVILTPPPPCHSPSILAGTVLSTLHGAVLCKNWHLCGYCWEDYERKCLHVPTSSEAATTVAGMIKAARG